jgi:hypothetical protein
MWVRSYLLYNLGKTRPQFIGWYGCGHLASQAESSRHLFKLRPMLGIGSASVHQLMHDDGGNLHTIAYARVDEYLRYTIGGCTGMPALADTL